MFDDSYFRTTLLRDVEAAGGHPIVEVQLLSGHAHRVRSILEVGTGTVTLETYITKGDLANERPHFGDVDSSAGDMKETFRTVIAYEGIAAVILDRTPAHVRVRPGFASA
jgi:hypothetical protein